MNKKVTQELDNLIAKLEWLSSLPLKELASARSMLSRTLTPEEMEQVDIRIQIIRLTSGVFLQIVK